MHNLRAIELFAGGGGLMLGTSLAGFDHIAAVEWEHNCCETLRLNQSHDYPLIGDAAIIESDVRAVDWSFAPDDLDLLAGGPRASRSLWADSRAPPSIRATCFLPTRRSYRRCTPVHSSSRTSKA